MRFFNPQVTIPQALMFSWESQARQYHNRGEPNSYRYERHYAGTEDKPGTGAPVDCLLAFDHRGVLVGILNHYPEGGDHGLEQPGNVNLWVHPRFQRQGIGSALFREAQKHWTIRLEQQRYSDSGAAFIRALQRKENG